ncbi:hypothetical protein [Arthrobacter sp. PAMC 25486]|uniref:hypothetical protein n=1 Tax=Arthrobacter sp. PAMC 25486 TaxID=1494608 RepID=UPI000A5818C2|nr:hypothetical protein [Arthrobacter sp. PAMC 25486]
MGIFSEAVDVVYSAQGALVQLSWRGVLYDVEPEPLCWYERRPWWQSDERLPPGAGVGTVDTQMWRLVLSGGEGQRFTLDVVHYRPADRWRAIKIYDAADDGAAASDDADADAAAAAADDDADPWQGLDGA